MLELWMKHSWIICFFKENTFGCCLRLQKKQALLELFVGAKRWACLCPLASQQADSPLPMQLHRWCRWLNLTTMHNVHPFHKYFFFTCLAAVQKNGLSWKRKGGRIVVKTSISSTVFTEKGDTIKILRHCIPSCPKKKKKDSRIPEFLTDVFQGKLREKPNPLEWFNKGLSDSASYNMLNSRSTLEAFFLKRQKADVCEKRIINFSSLKGAFKVTLFTLFLAWSTCHAPERLMDSNFHALENCKIRSSRIIQWAFETF